MSGAQTLNQSIRQALDVNWNESLIYPDIDASLAHEFLKLLEGPKGGFYEDHRVLFCYNSLLREISVKTPNFLYSITHRWIIETFYVHWQAHSIDRERLYCLQNARSNDLTGIYAGSYKEPGVTINSDGNKFPSIVLEPGYLKDGARLKDSKDLWLEGTSGECQVVILVTLDQKQNNEVGISLELWRRDGYTVYPLFPKPESEELPYLLIWEVYGGKQNVSEDVDPNKILCLPLDILRGMFLRAFGDLGLTASQ